MCSLIAVEFWMTILLSAILEPLDTSCSSIRVITLLSLEGIVKYIIRQFTCVTLNLQLLLKFFQR